MRQERKDELKLFFEAPKPLRKREFLRKMKPQKISMLQMMKVQVSYLPKWIWVFSVTVFLGAGVASRFGAEQMLGAVFAMIPFLVMVTVAGSIRSVLYGMSELEMTARFSLKSVLMIRMEILGIENLILLIGIAFLSGSGILRNMLYMLLPYLMTAAGGFLIMRKFASKEGTYLCAGFSAMISLIQLIGFEKYHWIYEARYIGVWGMAVAVFFYLTMREGYRTIKMAEGLAWS
ncbi:MAG: hypothetical protein E7256_04670 [Lachnospiraceae bacterium]|nr:hypothetical protein [Lachnospiraceae bacterium]